MRIAYYMPFKPLGHDNPSGDLTIGTDLFRFIQSRGHDIIPASRFRTRWIFLKPWMWPVYLFQLILALQRISRRRADVWLTYHSYYKAPDVLGPLCARCAKIPYILFQGIYSTKRKRKPATWAGFHLNRMVLASADFVLTNKKKDYANLQHIIPPDRLAYVGPGIVCRDFGFDPISRQALRKQWGCGHLPVVISAAMFRPGVKTQGMELIIRACANLCRKNLAFHLVLAGDGANRKLLESLANRVMPGRVRFLGRIQRQDLYRCYSAADLFAFPGIDESLGMVYLEAQSCGLPAVAFEDWGAREAILHGKTGYLSPAADLAAFEGHIRLLLEDKQRRKSMGAAAAAHIRAHHDLIVNYGIVENILKRFSSH